MNGRLKKMGSVEATASTATSNTNNSIPNKTQKTPLKLAKRNIEVQTFDHNGRCLKCNNDVPLEHTICLSCGYNLQTGEDFKKATKRINKKTKSQSPKTSFLNAKKIVGFCIGVMLYLLFCFRGPILAQFQHKTLAELPPLSDARTQFPNKLLRKVQLKNGLDAPPEKTLKSITYPSYSGPLAAYLSPKPNDHEKHPAIIWVFGGFDNSIDSTAWEPQPADNDQSASFFRKSGIVMMYPSMRGGNSNPGFLEGLYGEVNDIESAYEYLKQVDYVDPKRIYLGGHSTGGTLALLVAESTANFRAIFSLGPVGRTAVYGNEDFFFDTENNKQWLVRSPAFFLKHIQSPTFAFEGTDGSNNLSELQYMRDLNTNMKLKLYSIKKHDHFSLILPLTKLISQKILSDTEPQCNISFPFTQLKATNK
jgi:alpha/beta superfamily hydrolase